ncbi:DUF4399 domain-containing protein [Chloroflexi bacterium TSY]|nr:DUF4399 domain-containing protein [Chloroflexi bacterium TSY]
MKIVVTTRTLITISALTILIAFIISACAGSTEETKPNPTEPAATQESHASEPGVSPTEEPEGEGIQITDVVQRVFFRQPTANAIVPPTFTVIMGAEGLAVEPAGDIHEGAGHFHILIDADFIAPGEVIPNDELHIHYGDGSTETELNLKPGTYTLRLQMANGAHIALEGDQYRDEIVISVKEDTPEQAVRFAQPLDGATIPPMTEVVMAATGLVVEPAGDIHENAGHFHILIDTDFIPAGEVIPADEQHLHFGKAQTTTTIELSPGEHTLRLQMANGAHIAVAGDQYRDEVTVNVVEGASSPQVLFVKPENQATVTNPVDVRMSAAGLFVEPAGMVLRPEGGHMHILVDTDFIPTGEVIPKDEQHIHFGGGQLAAELDLQPGQHTLRLQMANGAHIALDGDQYRHEITIVVEGESTAKESSERASSEAVEKAEETTPVATPEPEEETPEEGALRSPQELWVSMSCSGCHNIDEEQSETNRGPVGPHMANFHERAGSRVDGQSAEEYTYTSIVEPNDFVVETYIANIMPSTFAEKMSEEEIRQLVSWLLDPERDQ